MNRHDDVPESERDRKSQRKVWVDILIIYGIFIALMIWNWWPR